VVEHVVWCNNAVHEAPWTDGDRRTTGGINVALEAAKACNLKTVFRYKIESQIKALRLLHGLFTVQPESVPEPKTTAAQDRKADRACNIDPPASLRIYGF
jgi:hypothetical protein